MRTRDINIAGTIVTNFTSFRNFLKKIFSMYLLFNLNALASYIRKYSVRILIGFPSKHETFREEVNNFRMFISEDLKPSETQFLYVLIYIK